MVEEEVRQIGLAHMRRMIAYAQGDGLVTDADGKTVGPGIPINSPMTGASYVVDPVKAKAQRIGWAHAYIAFCNDMGWLSDEEAWTLIRDLPVPPAHAV